MRIADGAVKRPTCGRMAVTMMILLVCGLATASARYLEPKIEYADNRFIVELYPDVGSLDPQVVNGVAHVWDPELSTLNERWSIGQVERLFRGDDPTSDPELNREGYWRFWFSKPTTTEDLESALEDFAKAKLVRHVEPVGIHQLYYSPNDPSWSSQWYIRSTAGDHDIDAVEGWDIQRGDTIAIYGVLDTGILYQTSGGHADIRPNLWRNWAERYGTNGVDDDGNGRVDDSVGYDFVSSGSNCWSGEDCSTADNDPKDFNGHGTHVSGIAAAVTNNSTGVAGIAGGGSPYSGARLMALRIGWSGSWFGMEVGYVGMDYAAQGIDYGRMKGVTAFNCSWGSSNTGGLGTAVTNAVNAGIIFCVAAGNDNSTNGDYLSDRGDLIDIAATDDADVKADFSNYGSWVDVSAPGVSIYSTYSNHYTATYEWLDGTSMAAPCVGGEVLLIKSRQPSWSRSQITPVVLNNVDNIYDENPGYSGQLGSGRINVNLALLAIGSSITTTSPNGGETWYIGESRSITWTSSGVSGNIKIELNRNYGGGGTWEVLFASITNDGTEPWPVAGAVTAAARVKVSSVSAPTVYDESNANFTIANPTITVTVPNGGETWIVGESNNITWTSAGFGSENVKIEVNRTFPGATWTTIVASTSNDGTHPWTVVSPTSTTARVRITGTVRTAIGDTSNANFNIGQRSITVTSPNGGENWTVGELRTITWSSAYAGATVGIEINRTYPSVSWETLAFGIDNTGSYPWTVTGPASTTCRVRLSSITYSSVKDTSNSNFTISAPNQAPTMTHDPLHDFAVGSGTVTAKATDPGLVATIGSVRMFYRLVSAGTFDSLALSTTGNPSEYAASLAFLGAGSYEYYLKVTDNLGAASYLPTTAPSTLYQFDVGTLCTITTAYDDGSAERFNWVEGGDGMGTQWAVKFGPVSTPYILCGAQFAASRSLPDSAHTPIYFAVYADGGGLPGTLIQDGVTGSVGNVIGGLPAGTNWAQILIKDDLGGPLQINSSPFYIAVGNVEVGKYEAFGRDTNLPNNHRSYVYDPCEDQWYSEDDTLSSDNAYPGNRLIRAQGYSLVPPQVTVIRSGNDIILNWNDLGAPRYRIYTASTSDGPFVSFATSTTNSYTHVGAVGAGYILFYQVRTESQ